MSDKNLLNLIEKEYKRALFFHKQGKLNEAENLYKKILSLNEKHYFSLENLGILFCQKKKYDLAKNIFLQALRINPNSEIAHNNLGSVYTELKEFNHALKLFNKAIQINPKFANAYFNLGNIYDKQQDYKNAIINYNQAIKINKNYPNPLNNLGNIYLNLKEYKKAIRYYQKAIKLDPKFTNAYYNLGNTYQKLQDYKNAIINYNQAIKINKNLVSAYYNLAIILNTINKQKEANVLFKKAIDMGSKPAISNYLYNLNFSTTHNKKEIYTEHKNHANKLLIQNEKIQHNNLSKKKFIPYTKIRIGFLSSDFRQHSVKYFLESIFEDYNRDKFEIYCFSNSIEEDKVTIRFRSLVDKFFSIYEMSDIETYNHIKSFNLHFLIELNGHTNGNRLCILKKGIAYKIISWIGYPNTTGLTTVDYKITDEFCDPKNKSNYYSEKELLRLDNFFTCYKPPNSLPSIKEFPYIKNSYLTFGSFNNYKKINNVIIKLWIQILSEFKDSIIILKNNKLHNNNQEEKIKKIFHQENISLSRIKFLNRIDNHYKHLDHYNDIDISLDTYPYSGTTTTFESLSMNRPVYSLVGDTHASRVSGSILNSLQLYKFIVDNQSKYLPKIIEIVNDKETFTTNYRKLLLQSRICDSQYFCNHLEKNFEKILLQ